MMTWRGGSGTLGIYSIILDYTEVLEYVFRVLYGRHTHIWAAFVQNKKEPRGSIYTTIRKLGPKIRYDRKNYSLMVVCVDPLGDINFELR